MSRQPAGRKTKRSSAQRLLLRVFLRLGRAEVGRQGFALNMSIISSLGTGFSGLEVQLLFEQVEMLWVWAWARPSGFTGHGVHRSPSPRLIVTICGSLLCVGCNAAMRQACCAPRCLASVVGIVGILSHVRLSATCSSTFIGIPRLGCVKKDFVKRT